jgi:hypothetical protein
MYSVRVEIKGFSIYHVIIVKETGDGKIYIQQQNAKKATGD